MCGPNGGVQHLIEMISLSAHDNISGSSGPSLTAYAPQTNRTEQVRQTARLDRALIAAMGDYPVEAPVAGVGGLVLTSLPGLDLGQAERVTHR